MSGRSVTRRPDRGRYNTIAAPGTQRDVLATPRHAATTDGALGPERSAPPSPTTPSDRTPRAKKPSLLTIVTTRAGLAHHAIRDTLNSPTSSATSFASASLWADSPSTGAQRRLSSILSPSGSTHSTIVPDAPSPITKEVYTEGLLGLSLLGLCHMLQERPSLQRAQVRSTRTFIDRPGLHRFLVCELLIGPDIFWLRLDRLRDRTVSRWRAPQRLFRTAAHDEVDVAAEASLLYDKAAKEENHQTFLHPLFLGELLHFLKAFCEEAHRYTTWPMNCWFLCSSVQEHLHTFHSGIFKKGALQHTNLAPHVRKRIRARLPPHYTTSTSTPLPPAPTDHRFRPPIVKAPPRRRALAMWGRTVPPLSRLLGSLSPTVDPDPPSPAHQPIPQRQRALTASYAPVGVGEDLPGQFVALDKEVQDVVRQCSRALVQRRGAEAVSGFPRDPVIRSLCKELSTEDYLSCTLASIFTQRVYERILAPVPSIWGNDDVGDSPRRRKTLALGATFNTIVQDLLDILPDGTDVPDDFQCDLKNILSRLYAWNERAAASPSFSCKYQAYAVKPFAEWDPGRMEMESEPSEPTSPLDMANRSNVPTETKHRPRVGERIILPLSLGLMQYQLRSGKWVPSVHTKAKVLVGASYGSSIDHTKSPESTRPESTITVTNASQISESAPLLLGQSSSGSDSRETVTPETSRPTSMTTMVGTGAEDGRDEVQAIVMSLAQEDAKLGDIRRSESPTSMLPPEPQEDLRYPPSTAHTSPTQPGLFGRLLRRLPQLILKPLRWGRH